MNHINSKQFIEITSLLLYEKIILSAADLTINRFIFLLLNQFFSVNVNTSTKEKHKQKKKTKVYIFVCDDVWSI